MNILIDLIPNSVLIDGVEYEINSDFRTSMLFEMLMQDNNVGDKDKILRVLELYYPSVPNNIETALEQIMWFYRGGKEIFTSSKKSNGRNSTQIYDFEHDDEYIYSSFLDQYGVDLQDIEYLHWWKFKAMFKSLKDDNMIVKIMGYRSVDLSKIKDKEQKKYYTDLKKLYDIPRSKDELEKINEIENILMNYGDTSKIL